eukprot:gene12701-55210_t
MGEHIFSLIPGDRLEMKGPFRRFRGLHNQFEHVGMVAEGSGLAPFYKYLMAMLKHPRDKQQFSLVYQSKSPEDVMMGHELTDLAWKHNRKFFLYNTVLDSGGYDCPTLGLGPINKDILK